MSGVRKWGYRPEGLDGVPIHLRDGIDRYIRHGVRPGSGLCAVLSNDLVGAVTRLDETSQAGLPELVRFLVNNAPSECWGSRAALEAWTSLGGIHGQARRAI